MAEELTTYRDSLPRTVPRWLRGRIGGGLLYVIGMHLDALSLAATAATRRRFPGLDGYGDEVEPLGLERRIRRGRAEPDASYTVRMQSWLDDHRVRGGPYAMLRQLHGYYITSPRAIDLVYENGRRYHMATDGTITRDTIPWITATPKPLRFWVVINWTETVTDDGIWSDPGTWDDGGTWNFGITAAEIAEIQTVPQDWQPGHALGYVCLVPPALTDITTIDPLIWDDNAALETVGISRYAIPN